MTNLAGLLVPMEGGYTPPGVEDFEFHGLFGTTWLNKPMLQLIIAFVLVVVFWLFAARRLNVVPTKFQYFTEYVYDFIRNGVARDVIGHGYQKWTPFLLGVFCWVLLNNWFGEFFYFMFPTFSNIGYAYGLALMVWIIYVVVGFKVHGMKYLKMSLIPSGVPWYLLFLIVPVEFLSNFITRPLTLSVRLFANMFAGHLAVLVFVVGGAYLVTYSGNLFYNAAGVASTIAGLLILCLEVFIGFLQAYILTILTAQYIGSSLASEH